MTEVLHIDVETFSSEDIRTAGAYRYCQSIDFEILMIAYSFGKGPIKMVDLCQGEKIPLEFINALTCASVLKKAHNANFERNAFKAYGYDVPIQEWECTAVKAGYCGLPIGLDALSRVLQLADKGKLATGKALIRYFCRPCKPTKTNDQRLRNMPHHDTEKWEEFKLYCINDVEAERTVSETIKDYSLTDAEADNYVLDQEINDRGIEIDLIMAANAYEMDQKHSAVLLQQIKEITGLDNPNSPAQLKKWLSEELGQNVTSLAKGMMPTLIETAGEGLAGDVLALRGKASKTSIKKYLAMLNCVGSDGRARGLLQFYGANRTGRWAGRLVQLQNLPQNHLKELAMARQVFAAGDYDLAKLLYDNISSTLSQLIRTAFVAKKGHTFGVADFSAIEARVIAWLANEVWRLEVFKTHGKIYEASASMMFGVPLEEVTKGSDYRAKGKVAELALGYQGAVGALKQMGGERMGLSETEMKTIVKKWRSKNPAIVEMWKKIEAAAIRATKNKRTPVRLSRYKGVTFLHDGRVLTLTLPSGRKLFYQEAQVYSKTTKSTYGPWTRDAIRYKGIRQETKQWGWIDTYGGKLTENIIQAIARDILADAMLRIDRNEYDIVMHVHDEAVCELPIEDAEDDLKIIEDIMSTPIEWAKGLPLGADGYITPFYKKD